MLKFIKRIETKEHSIFYSFIHYKDEIIGFYRKHYGSGHKVNKIKIDEEFNIIEDNDETFNGEDPRCFIHEERYQNSEYNKDTLYVTDNYVDKQQLYNYENKSYIRIKYRGKNLSFISHKNTMYFIYKTKPFLLCKLYPTCGVAKEIETDGSNEKDLVYRGGTPGYRFKKNENKYYGFGHKTYDDSNNILKHDIFLWIVDFTNDKPSIKVTDVEKPPNAKNICDPTCVIEINNKLYMVTAESDEAWFLDQDYVTNVYEITDVEFIEMVNG